MGHPARRAVDIVVAVLDSGVAFRDVTIRYNSRFSFRLTPGGPVYPALGHRRRAVCRGARARRQRRRFVAPRDFIWDDELPVDLDGHGTHVAGTIGQLTNNSVGVAGMAYNVRIMPVKVIEGVWDDIFGSPFAGTDDVVARGIRYAADNGAKVINMSIGRTEGGAAPVVKKRCATRSSRGCSSPWRRATPANRQPAEPPRGAGARASTAWWPWAPSAARSTTRTTRPRERMSRSRRRAAISAQGGTSGGILQQTLDQDLLETYSGRAAVRPAARRCVRYYFFQGTSMATPHVVGLRGAADPAGHHEPGGHRSGDEAVRDRQGRAGTRQRVRRGPDQPRATLRGLGLAR